MPESTDHPSNDLPSEDLPKATLGSSMPPLGIQRPLIPARPLGLHTQWIQPKFIYPLGAISIANPNNLQLAEDFNLLNTSIREAPIADPPAVSPQTKSSVPNPVVTPSTEAIQRDAIDDVAIAPPALRSLESTTELKRSESTPAITPPNTKASPQPSLGKQIQRSSASDRDSTTQQPASLQTSQTPTIQAKAELSPAPSSGITPELMQIMQANKALSSNRESTAKPPSNIDSSQSSTTPQSEISESVNAAEVPIQAKAEPSPAPSSGITPELMQIMRENKALSSNRESAAKPPSNTESPVPSSTAQQTQISESASNTEVPIQAKAEPSPASSSGITPELMQIMRENKALSSNRNSGANPPSNVESPTPSSTAPQSEISQSVNAAEVPIQAKTELSPAPSSGITPELMQIMRENKALSSNRDSIQKKTSDVDSTTTADASTAMPVQMKAANPDTVQTQSPSSEVSISSTSPQNEGFVRRSQDVSIDRSPSTPVTPSNVPVEPLGSVPSTTPSTAQSITPLQKKSDSPSSTESKTTSIPSSSQVNPPATNSPTTNSPTTNSPVTNPQTVSAQATNPQTANPQTTSPSSQSVGSVAFTTEASPQAVSEPSIPIQRQAEVSANSSPTDSVTLISDSQDIAPLVSDLPAKPFETNTVASSEPLPKAIDAPPSQTPPSPNTEIQRKVEAPPASSTSVPTPPQMEVSETTNISENISESSPLPSLQLKPHATDVVQTEPTSISQDAPISIPPIQRKPEAISETISEATTSSPISAPQTDLETNLASPVVTFPSLSIPDAKNISSPPVSDRPTTLQRQSEDSSNPVAQISQSNVEPSLNLETSTPETSNTVTSIQPSRDRVVSQDINPVIVQKTPSDPIPPVRASSQPEIQTASEIPIQAKPATNSDPLVSESLSDLGNMNAIATNQTPVQPASSAQTPIQKKSETKSTPSLGAAIAKTVWDGLTSLFQSPQPQTSRQDTTAPLQRKSSSSSASSSTPIQRVSTTPATLATNDASPPEQTATPINPQTTVDNQTASSLPSQVLQQGATSGSSEPIVSNKAETPNRTEGLGIQRKASPQPIQPTQPTQPIASESSTAKDSSRQEFSNTPASNLLAPIQKQNEIGISRKSEDLGIQRKAPSQPTNLAQTPSPTANEISSSQSSPPNISSDVPPAIQKQAEPSLPDIEGIESSSSNISDAPPIIQKQADHNVSATEGIELIAPISESIGIQRQEVDISQLSSPSANDTYSYRGIDPIASEPISIQRQVESSESNVIEDNLRFDRVIDPRPPEPTSIQRQVASKESTADETEAASSTENIDIQRKSLTTQASQPQSSMSQPMSPTAIESSDPITQGISSDAETISVQRTVATESANIPQSQSLAVDESTNDAQTQNLFNDSLPNQPLDSSNTGSMSIQRQIESRESNSDENDSRFNLPIDSNTPETTSIQRQIESNQSTVNEPEAVSVPESIDIQKKSLTQPPQSQSNIAQSTDPAALESSESISSESVSSRTGVDRTPENISVQRKTSPQPANISQTPSPVVTEASSNQPSAPSMSAVFPTIQTQANPTSLPTTEGIEIVSIANSEDTGIQRQASDPVVDISQSPSLPTDDSRSNQLIDFSTPEPTSIQRQAESSEAIAAESGIPKDTGTIDIQRKNLAQSAQPQSNISQPINLATIESSQLSTPEFSSDRDTENISENISIQRKASSDRSTNITQTPNLTVNETPSNQSSVPFSDISDVTPTIQKQAEPSGSVPEGMKIASDRENTDIQRQTSDPVISQPLSSTVNDLRDRQAIDSLAPEPASIQRQVELNETARETEIPTNIEGANVQRNESTQITPSQLNQSNTTQSSNLAFSDSVSTEPSDSIIPNVPTSIQKQAESSLPIPEITSGAEDVDIQRQTSDPVVDVSQLSSTANDLRDRQAIDSLPPESTSIQRQIESNESIPNESEIPNNVGNIDVQRQSLTPPNLPPQSNILSNISATTNLAATQSSEPSAQESSSDPENISIQRKTLEQPTNIAQTPSPVVETLNQESLSDVPLEIQTQAETSLPAVEVVEIASDFESEGIQRQASNRTTDIPSSSSLTPNDLHSDRVVDSRTAEPTSIQRQVELTQPNTNESEIPSNTENLDIQSKSLTSPTSPQSNIAQPINLEPIESSEPTTQGRNPENISIQREASELLTNTSQPTNQTAIPSHEPTLGISDVPPVIQKQAESSLTGIEDIEITTNAAGNTEDAGIQRKTLDRLTKISELPSLATNDSLGTQSVDLSIPEPLMQRQSESSDVPIGIQRQVESNVEPNVNFSESTTPEIVSDRDLPQGIGIQRTPAAEAIADSQSFSLEVSDSVRNESLDSTTPNSIASSQPQAESSQADLVSIQRQSSSQPVESPSSRISQASETNTDSFSLTPSPTDLPPLQRKAEVSEIVSTTPSSEIPSSPVQKQSQEIGTERENINNLSIDFPDATSSIQRKVQGELQSEIQPESALTQTDISSSLANAMSPIQKQADTSADVSSDRSSLEDIIPKAEQLSDIPSLENPLSSLQRKIEPIDRIINREQVSTENASTENLVESSPQPDIQPTVQTTIQRDASEQSTSRSPAIASTNEQSETIINQPVTDPEPSDLETPLQLKSERSESRSSLSSEIPNPEQNESAIPSFPLLPTVLNTISRSSPLGRAPDVIGNTSSPIGSQTANGILSQTVDPTALQAKFNAPLEYPFDLAPPIQRSADKRSPFNPSTSSPESKLSSLPSTIQRMFAPESDNSTSDDRNDGALNLPEPTSTVPDTWSSLADLVGAITSSPASSSLINASQASAAPASSLQIVQRQSDSGSSTSAWSSIQELISDRKTTNTRSSLAPSSQVQEPVIQRFKDSSEVGVSYGDRDNANEEADISTNLEILAQEIYVLLRQRLAIERERHGSGYSGQLPW
ncbi:hypothetical protein TUMEXPCC7403_11630 [Tumidithrix helvetica PCC 7403]|uniref:hypothetical protein n=1 Tax=Tumidithrix helvetica TaxID=3457545 RepID=UPI003CC3AA5E